MSKNYRQNGQPADLLEVYISGPMRGRVGLNKAAFQKVHSWIQDKGVLRDETHKPYIVGSIFNPAETKDETVRAFLAPTATQGSRQWDLTFLDYIRYDLHILSRKNTLVLLPGWYDSEGARIEVQIGLELGFYFWDGETLDPYPVHRIEYELANRKPCKDPPSEEIAEQLDKICGKPFFDESVDGVAGPPFKASLKDFLEERDSYSTGAKRDTRKGKGRYDLISPYMMERLAWVMEKGANHYGARNWEKGMPQSRFMDSALRHLFQYCVNPVSVADDGDDHLAQAIFNIMAMIHQETLFEYYDMELFDLG